MTVRDTIVIGGGPAGYVAAIRASQLGASVTLVEENKLGGTCINCGCIPTKFLLHRLDLRRSVNAIAQQGMATPPIQVASAALQDHKNEIVSLGVAGIRGLLRSNQVEVITGRAQLSSGKSVEVHSSSGEERNIQGKKIIIATGSKPVKIAIPGADDPDVMARDNA